MNTSKLEEILKKIECIKNTFGGVYPSNLLPLEVKQYPQSFEANVDASFTHDQHGEFFDSCGLSPHRNKLFWKIP